MDSADHIFGFAHEYFKQHAFSVLGDRDQISDQACFCDSLFFKLVFLA